MNLRATMISTQDRQLVTSPEKVTRAKRLPVSWWVFLASIVFVVIEGAIRKWVIGESGAVFYMVYFSKDILFLSLLLFSSSISLTDERKSVRYVVYFGIALIIMGGIVSATQDINYVGAFLTIRAVVLLPLAAIFIATRIRDISLVQVALVIAGLAIGNFFLAMIQYNLPADHILNRYSSFTENIVTLESGVRVTGTFSYISGLGVMSSVGIWAGLVLLSMSNSQIVKYLGWASVVAGFGCALTSASRSSTLFGLISVPVWLIFSRKASYSLLRNMLAAIALLICLYVFDYIPEFSNMAEALWQRNETAGDTLSERIFDPIWQITSAFDLAPMGLGLGTEQVGGNYYSTGMLSFTTFEYQYPRIILELGVLGLIGFIVLCVGTLILVQQVRQASLDIGYRSALLLTQILLGYFFYTNIAFNHTTSAISWMLFAVILAQNPPKTDKLNYENLSIASSRQH